MKHKNYHSNLAFLDLFLNALLGFVFLFLVSWLLINPVAKNKDIEARGEFFITITWPDESTDDVDLWVQDPHGRVLWYGGRETTLMNLDRDDMGLITDTITNPDGTKTFIRFNKEVASIRGIVSGEFLVNLVMYNKRDSNSTPVTIEVVKINPYSIVHKSVVAMDTHKQEKTAVRFSMDSAGKVTGSNTLPKNITTGSMGMSGGSIGHTP